MRDTKRLLTPIRKRQDRVVFSRTFFLSGRAAEMLDQKPTVYFDFDVSRLVDTDGDDWLEYTGRDGETFRLIDRRTAIYCEETDKIISAET